MTREEFDAQLLYLKSQKKDICESLDNSYADKNWEEIDIYEDLLMRNNHKQADLRIQYLLEV